MGIVPLHWETCAHAPALAAARERVHWLPDPGPWRYLADPFGIRKGNTAHVFVEAFDYRDKHAVIEHHQIEVGSGMIWRGCEVVLQGPQHLSYPFLIEHGGEVFMIPECHRSREVALYRARKFPGDWVRETTLLKGLPVAEPSVVQHAGKWWMFFTLVGAQARDQRELHLAYAERLTGPWTIHPQNPVVEDKGGARPGGTPLIGRDGKVLLPVQDCRESYGGGLRFLRFSVLETDRVIAELLPAALSGALVSDTHTAGFHTFAQCGELTLIDTKRVVRSRARTWIDWRRRLKRLVG
ncbi:MAG: glycosyl hydrolase family 43 [Opitutus sp.]